MSANQPANASRGDCSETDPKSCDQGPPALEADSHSLPSSRVTSTSEEPGSAILVNPDMICPSGSVGLLRSAPSSLIREATSKADLQRQKRGCFYSLYYNSGGKQSIYDL